LFQIIFVYSNGIALDNWYLWDSKFFILHLLWSFFSQRYCCASDLAVSHKETWMY
jgi:hypothetical protein